MARRNDRLRSEPGTQSADPNGHAVIVTLGCIGGTSEALAELARTDAERHRPRTPERRAASALWAALVTTPTPDAARSALAEFADSRTLADAGELLDRLAARPCAVAWDGERGTYACGNCGAVARPDVVNPHLMTRAHARENLWNAR
jgi:hypothetical protein